VIVPALNFEGWYDIFVAGGVENFAGMRKQGGSAVAREGQRLVVGPWVHLGWNQKVGAIDFGPEAVSRIQKLQFAWFDCWRKGTQNGGEKKQKARLSARGQNKCRPANDGRVEGPVFPNSPLHTKGAANTSTGNGVMALTKPAGSAGSKPDKYKYDPANPV